MAAATRSRAAKKATPAKPAPTPEPEEELEELGDEEFEEIEEAPAEAAATTKKPRANADVTFGVAHLAEHLTQKSGQEVTTRELRTLIRRMAREEKAGGPRVNREIVPGNRTRYDWPLGLKDPEVKAIIAAYLGGEAKEAKQEALNALKERNAAVRAEKAKTPAKPAAKKATSKKAPEPVVEEDDSDDEELEFDDED